MKKGCVYVSDSERRLELGYEDREVEAFGGMDYEVVYTLDAANRQKLRSALEEDGASGPLEETIPAFFGIYLEKVPFSLYCLARGIRCELSTSLS